MLINQTIYLACDKGNKKGMCHFVKMLCCWDRAQKVVQTQVLGIDACGGSAVECAHAVPSSVNKLNNQDDIDTNLLSGQ